VHHLADVRQPLRPRRLELAADELAHVVAGRGLALRAVAEVQAPAHEGHMIPAHAPRLREHQRRVAHALDHDGGRRASVAAQRLDVEPLELGLGVLSQPLVQQLLVDAGDPVEHDHPAARVGHRGDVPDELHVVDGIPQGDSFRAARRIRSAVEEPVLRHMLNVA
jgi:hypothetical protein